MATSTRTTATRGARTRVQGFLDRAFEGDRRSGVAGVAVIEDGRLAWTAGAGASNEVVFQAGSLSKSVTSALALELAERGQLELDEDLREHLAAWQIAVGTRPVTLRELLGHTAGVNVAFCPGYPQGAAVPTLAQSMQGSDPGTTAAVTVDPSTAGRFRYSGGGYAVIQRLIEEVTREPFDVTARKLVFDRLGMAQSSFAQPPELQHPAAWAQWRLYPEQAAAGLWSTPTDLAHFVWALQAALRGNGDGLARETAVAMTTPHADLPFRGQWTALRFLGLNFPRSAGLGLFVGKNRFMNLGGAAGSFSALTGSINDGTGAVVMTAGCRSPFAVRLLLEIGDAHGWTDLPAFRRGIRREVSGLLLRALN